MSYFTNQEKKTVWWYDNDANAPGGLVKIDEAVAMAIANPPPTLEQQAVAVRAERDARLEETDLIIIRCAETSEPVPDEWKTYRQALRDIPQQANFPDDVIWPEQPEGSVQATAEKEGMTETQAAAVPQAA